MKEQETVKVEFLLKLNSSIIVQRFFNVRGYNPDAKNSMNLYDYIKNVKESIEYDLKMKTVEYLLENSDAIIDDPEILNTSMTDEDEYFNLYIKIDDKVISHRQFNAKLYPPKVRYTVDLRPLLKNIMSGFSTIFSEGNEKLNYNYLGYNLMV
jgi:hypothetical protein